MQDQGTGSCCEDAGRDEIELVEAAILNCVLVDDGHLWSREDLQREFDGNELHFADALDGLKRAGLITLGEETVSPSRAARRMDELAF